MLLLLLLAASGCNTVLPAHETTCKAQSGDQPVTDPDRLWAIKLCAVVIQANGQRQDYLSPQDRTNQANVEITKKVMVRDWGIHDRNELLTEMRSLLTDGHAPVFMELVALIESGISEGKDIPTILAEQKIVLSQKQYNYLGYIADNLPSFHGKDLILWDWGRIISLARWGFAVGYLTEDEAWSIIMPLAEGLRTRYSSWQEYGKLYALTRATWAAGFGQAYLYYTKSYGIVLQLMSPGGVWSLSRWPTTPIVPTRPGSEQDNHMLSLRNIK